MCVDVGWVRCMKKLLCALVVVVACALLWTPGWTQAKDLEALQKQDLDRLLEKNKGKVVMLNFFATWCPPCRAEIPELVKANAKYGNKNVVILGLSVDDPKAKATVEKFLAQMQVPYPVYLAGRDLIAAYSVGSIPHNVFYDKAGNMIISQPGECDFEDFKLVVEELLHDN